MKLEQRHKAVEMRLKGYSLNEISRDLKVAKSSVSYWVRDIVLSEKAKQILIGKIQKGRYISAENKKAKTRQLEERYFNEAKDEILKNPNHEKIICAALYWCEGNKGLRGGLTFTNSDPVLVAKFLELLRKSFDLNESKFHPCIHLHSYHSAEKQLDFWSKITKIRKEQFIKPYRKLNSGKRIHPGYQGCISLKYHSNDLARRVMAVAKAYLSL